MSGDDQVDDERVALQLLAAAIGAAVAGLFLVAMTKPRRRKVAIDRRTGEQLELEQLVERANDLTEQLERERQDRKLVDALTAPPSPEYVKISIPAGGRCPDCNGFGNVCGVMCATCDGKGGTAPPAEGG